MVRVIFLTALVLLVVVYAGLAVLARGSGMTEIFLINELQTLGRTLLVVGSVFITLRVFDLLTGVNIKEWLANASNPDRAIYFAVRFFAICLLFGLVSLSAN